MAIVYVRWDRETEPSDRGPRSWVACSMCLGTGSIQRGKGWLTCPSCYATGIKDLVYETGQRHG